MPVRNGERYLPEAMESILGQTFADFELVVIDDESTDATPELLAGYRSRDDRIRVVRKHSEGLVAALNHGCAIARAPYVARMDVDDIAAPERLEHQLGYLAEHPEVALLGTGHTEIDGEGRILGTTSYPASMEAVAERLPTKNCFAHPTVVFSRAVFDAVGGYRAALLHAEDYDLWLRMSDGHPVANLAAPLLAYRVHPGSVSLQNRRQQTLSTLAAQAAARIRRAGGDDGLSDEAVVTIEVLERMGLSRAEIARNVFATCSGQAERALAGGHDGLALRFATEALACAADIPLSRDERAHLHRIAAIAAFNENHRLRAAWAFAAGVAARPTLATGLLRRMARSLSTAGKESERRDAADA
jgi:glycosyltransferase involved in cell wall biosynthesis